jgi:hypothetical protein
MQVLLIVAGLLLSSQQLFAQARNPLGETASYQLDRNRSRTTSLIRSGAMAGEVTRAIPDEGAGVHYEVKLDYQLDVSFVGRQEGTCRLPFHQDFFSPEFMAMLRETGVYETAAFKLRHEGYATARNLDGNTYENCDRVRMYDIDLSLCEMLFKEIAGVDTLDSIENLEIATHIHLSTPVLSAVKLDFSGRASGTNFIAGADYITP